ncbi:protein PHLOEM PROTEIN 2-LIKE A10 isoform X2 [Sorghum bicolor]|uniref:protein PHLOEM PROTEIN 2-LIKE A10 isoform X2 n=1 Tax=Sorghum bicolor TaxID=4558 RepID=UPI00081AE4E7|nr:protein PHLOEM PROTEIN 2-LIKE A10 isoform X2 [Sorghum bicolor]XP_021310019.1 protein PHLOEM PROTEIN 2-LIKE A10 isoform X2 [Sorghum bicolor]|eukprot:XP_021310018.1 protein PHLOEM PROTEIN 2-LIKE A10 isoform X2 [Sorghum bicolor]
MYRRRALAFARRRRRWLLWAGAAAGCYLIYRHPAVAARRRRLARLASALASLADAAAAVASDLAAFLRSDSDAVPQTLKQVSKLAASPEASASVSALSGAVAAGVLRGYYAAAPGSGAAPGTEVSISDRVLDRVLSPDGERLASAVAGSFGSHLVLAFYSAPPQPSATDASSASWVDALTTPRGQRAIRSWVEVFTATAVGVFIDKTIHINTYDQLFAAATNPDYGARLQELFIALCSTSVETLVKTSHGVLSSTSRNASGTGSSVSSSSSNGGAGEGWMETVSSALAVPSNRKLVLDLTGRATFEAVQSFLEFVLWKLHAGARAGGCTDKVTYHYQSLYHLCLQIRFLGVGLGMCTSSGEPSSLGCWAPSPCLVHSELSGRRLEKTTVQSAFPCQIWSASGYPSFRWERRPCMKFSAYFLTF